MFTHARLKLTLWYTVILMLVSLLFSAVLYRVVANELERGFHRAELRFRTNDFGLRMPMPSGMRIFLTEDVEEAKRQVLERLMSINAFILAAAAIGSYVLAGKSLSPIQVALEEQKRFVTDASHELRTPLSALKTSLEVALRDKKLSPKNARRIMTDSLEEVNELTSLSQDLLLLARFEKNGQSLSLVRIDVGDVVRHVVKRLLPLAKKKSIVLEIQAGNEITEVDEASLDKLMTILIDNAIKYSSDGSEVKVAVTTAGKWLTLSVTDTGPGIAPKDVPHIFDRFYRADASRTKDGSTGFGLGLAIAKRIVDLHRGDISVKSRLGKGSTFTVRLPRAV